MLRRTLLPSANEHAEVVLSAIISASRRDLLDTATKKLTRDHFTEPIHSKIFGYLLKYSEISGGAVMPLKFLGDNLRGRMEVGQYQLFSETYEELADHHPDDSEFAWSVEQLRELAAERATGEALTESMDILKRGKTIGTETLIGHEAARARILEAFQEIDRGLTLQEAPEGSLQDEATEMKADYAKRKSDRIRGISSGIRFGVDSLDRKVGGIQPGELVLVAGHSSDGKSTFCVQSAWSASVEQGKNVVFLTTETLREQIRRKLVARHSKHPMFGLADGLNTRDLKAGTLPEDQESILPQVVDDLAHNPTYGRLHLVQIPRGAGITSIEQRLYSIQRRFEVDMVVMDYLALLMSERHRQTIREELSSTLKNAKLLATSFDGGRGFPFMSPWQVSRSARENAEKMGYYTMDATSETAEATNSSDIILSLLAPSDNNDRRATLNMQVLKNRDGETAGSLSVDVDYATCCFRSQRLMTDLPRSAFDPVGTTAMDLLS